MNNKRYHTLLLLIVAMLWGLAYPLLKTTTADTPTSLMLALRFTLAGVVLLILFYRRIRSNFSFDLLKQMFFVSTVQYADYFCYSFGMNFTSAINGGFYSGIPLLFIPFILLVWDKKPLKGQKLWAIAIIIVGVFLLSSDSGRITFNIGDLFCLAASFLFGLYIVMTGRGQLRNYDPLTRTAMQMFSVALWAWITAAVTGDLPAIATIGLISWRNIILMGIFCTAADFALQLFVQDQVNPLAASIIYATLPLFAALFSVLLLGERLGVLGVAGGLIICGGIIARELSLN
ncbi:MAG: DMT family transporter, partial [Clostridiales bacterium]